MHIPNPWSWVPEPKQAPFFLFALLLTLAVLLALQVLGAPLRTDAAPAGIISYELAGTLTAAQEILESWGPQGRTYAGVNLGLDYLFLCAYAASIGLACILVSRRFKPGSPPHTAGVLLAWALVLAAALDALENYALIRLLLGSTGGGLPALARSAALVKFLLVLLGLLYAILAGLAALFFRPREKGSAG
jgi:hypothetical protein